MFVYNVRECDFVVWAPKFLIVIHFPRDEELISEMIEKCEFMFSKHILLELLARRKAHSNPNPIVTSENSNEENVYCLCQEPEDDRKDIGCDNAKCEVQWYHLDCLKLKREPKGTWLCPMCRKRRKHFRDTKLVEYRD